MKNNYREILENFSPCPQGTCFTNNNIVEQYDLHIIIPAFNVEQYIEKSLMSVLNQKTTYSFLVTVVNDGSTDSTGEILEKIYSSVQGKNNFEIINQKNSGVSAARNNALKNIKGKYVMFLDSDDYIPDGAIQNMMDASEDADIVQGNWDVINENNSKRKECTGMSGFPWGKIYKSYLIKNFQFPDGYWYQDTPITYFFGGMNLKIKNIDAVVYCYRVNYGGISKSGIKKNKCIQTAWITELCIAEAYKFGITNSTREFDYFLKQTIINYRRTRNVPLKVKKAIYYLYLDIKNNYFKNIKNSKYNSIKVSLDSNSFFLYSLVMLYFNVIYVIKNKILS